MFKALQPLLAERSIHILLSPSKDGKVAVYVEPVKVEDKEDNAFVTPFRCEGTPEELDVELSGVLTQWLTSRAAVTTSLREALVAAEAEAKAAAEEAKKKAAERSKKTTTTPKSATPSTKAAPAQGVTPTLLDGAGDDDECGEAVKGDGGDQTAPADPAAEAPVPIVEAQTAPVAPGEAVPKSPAPAPSPSPSAAIVSADPVTVDLF